MAVMPWASTHLHRPGASVTDVLDDSLGIYSTQPTVHLELLARVDGYALADLDQVLVVDRSAAQLRSLRGSSFTLPVHLLPVTQAATRDRNVRSTRSFVARSLHGDDYETWAERIEALLAGGPLTADEIRRRLDPPEADAGAIRYVVALMATENRIVKAGTFGGWRSNRAPLALWSRWLDVDVWSLDAGAAQTELARLYLDRHGPATVADFAWWSGLTKTQAAAGFAEVAVPVPGTDWWETRPPRAPGPPPLRLLPIWDTLFVTYRDRSRFLAEEHYHLVYDADGNATSVVLVEGRAAGVWDLGADDDHLVVKVAPFDVFTAAQWDAIGGEADRIGALIGSSSVSVTRCPGPPPDLGAAPRNRFMSPLREVGTGRRGAV